MKSLNKNEIGLIIGLFFAVFHIGWSLLVAFGYAQVFIDWVMWLHFVSIPISIDSFDISRAVLLTLFTFVVGYLLGWVSTLIWNMIIKKSK